MARTIRNGLEVCETVTLTLRDGKVQVFDVCSDPDRQWSGLRAYIRDTSQYYDMSVFERGLGSGKAASVFRVMVTDVFAYDDLLQASK